MSTVTPAKMKVDQLRTELRNRGLDTSGTKPILVARLVDALNTPVPDVPANSASNSAAEPDSVDGAPAEPPKSAEAAVPAHETTVVKPKPTESRDDEKGLSGKQLKGSKPLEAMTYVERAASRAARFGGTVEGKMAMRAERFGLLGGGEPGQETTNSGNGNQNSRPSREADALDDVAAKEAARRAKRAKRFAAAQ
jgi:SAP domain